MAVECKRGDWIVVGIQYRCEIRERKYFRFALSCGKKYFLSTIAESNLVCLNRLLVRRKRCRLCRRQNVEIISLAYVSTTSSVSAWYFHKTLQN